MITRDRQDQKLSALKIPDVTVQRLTEARRREIGEAIFALYKPATFSARKK